MAFTQRSARTRSAILAAARQRFAADGYDRATIRAIAADAEIDPSMVIRYFGSKAELFVAASVIELGIPGPEGRNRYADAFMDRWEAGDNLAEAILMRTAPTEPGAVERLQALFEEQVVPPLRAARPDDPHLRERAALMFSQTIGMAYCRYLFGLEPIASMDRRLVRDALHRTLHDYLSGPLPFSDGDGNRTGGAGRVGKKKRSSGS